MFTRLLARLGGFGELFETSIIDLSPIGRSVSRRITLRTDNDFTTLRLFDRPSGTGLSGVVTQALRAWLRSACPSGQKLFAHPRASHRKVSTYVG
jgi:hypothetical protein